MILLYIIKRIQKKGKTITLNRIRIEILTMLQTPGMIEKLKINQK